MATATSAIHGGLTLLLTSLLALGCISKDIDAADDESETDTGTGEGTGDDHNGNAGDNSCNPLEQNCDGGLGCYLGNSDTLFSCEPIGWGISEGQPCTYPNDCLPGLVCLTGELQLGCGDSLGCCARFCDLDKPSCPGGTACLAFFTDTPPPAYDNVGACLIP